MEYLRLCVASVPDPTLALLLEEFVLGVGRADQPSALQARQRMRWLPPWARAGFCKPSACVLPGRRAGGGGRLRGGVGAAQGGADQREPRCLGRAAAAAQPDGLSGEPGRGDT